MTPSPPAPSSADPVNIREKKENAPRRSLFLHLSSNVERAFLRTGPQAGRCRHRPLRRSIGKQCVGAEPCPPHWQSIRRGRCLHRPAPPYFLQPVIARAQSARGDPFFPVLAQGYYGFPRRFAPRNDRQGSAPVRSNSTSPSHMPNDRRRQKRRQRGHHHRRAHGQAQQV